MDRINVLAALAALGQETRLDAFRLLVRAGQDGMPAGEIAARLGVVQNTMSSHFKILLQAGLVRMSREGRILRYSADMIGFGEVLSYLMEDCCSGNPELCRPVIAAVTCSCGGEPHPVADATPAKGAVT